MPSIVPDIESTFYFGMHFAPIFDPEELDTPSKRFGFVLSVMRRAKAMTQVEFENRLFPGSKRGGSTVSDWENGKSDPTPSELRRIFEVLELDANDKRYLLGLLFDSSEDEYLTAEQQKRALEKFAPFKNGTNPAYLIDHYWQVLDFNASIQQIPGLADHTIENMRRKEHTLLDVIFDPIYGIAQLVGDTEAYNQMALEQIWRFRTDTTLLRSQRRYISLLYRLTRQSNFLFLWYEDPPKINTVYERVESIDITFSPAPDVKLQAKLKSHDMNFIAHQRVYVVEWLLS